MEEQYILPLFWLPVVAIVLILGFIYMEKPEVPKEVRTIDSDSEGDGTESV